MKKMLCPQCKIAAMYVKNAAGERLLVYVTDQGEVVPKDPSQSLEGFDVSEVFCLGCSWHGSPKRLVRYYCAEKRIFTGKILGIYCTFPVSVCTFFARKSGIQDK